MLYSFVAVQEDIDSINSLLLYYIVNYFGPGHDGKLHSVVEFRCG